MPMPAGAAAEPPQLTEAQHQLRKAIASRAHEERQLGSVTERLGRLEQVLADDRQLEAQIRELQLAHQSSRALWLENGSIGAEPKPSKELMEANFSHAQAQADVAAAMMRSPAVAGEQRAAVERLSAASREVDLAVYNCAIEACRPVAERAAAGLRQGLAELAKLHAVRDALRQGDDDAAYRAASLIDPIIAEARAAGVPPAPEVGPQLLRSLHVNPAAALP